jgi:hypothetical protein
MKSILWGKALSWWIPPAEPKHAISNIVRLAGILPFGCARRLHKAHTVPTPYKAVSSCLFREVHGINGKQPTESFHVFINGLIVIRELYLLSQKANSQVNSPDMRLIRKHVTIQQVQCQVNSWKSRTVGKVILGRMPPSRPHIHSFTIHYMKCLFCHLLLCLDLSFRSCWEGQGIRNAVHLWFHKRILTKDHDRKFAEYGLGLLVEIGTKRLWCTNLQADVVRNSIKTTIRSENQNYWQQWTKRLIRNRQSNLLWDSLCGMFPRPRVCRDIR